MKSVIIIGAGGHGKVVADVIERQNEYEIIGFLDDNTILWGKEIYGYKVLGGFDSIFDDKLSDLIIIAIGDNKNRRQLVEQFDTMLWDYANCIHPSAHIARDVRLGKGIMMIANTVVNPGSVIGNHTIINTGAIVEHDCMIGDFVHISPGAVLAGNVIVNENTHVGMGSCILPGIKIGANCIIGAGTVVTRDIPDGLTVVGVPGRPVKFNEFNVTSVRANG